MEKQLMHRPTVTILIFSVPLIVWLINYSGGSPTAVQAWQPYPLWELIP